MTIDTDTDWVRTVEALGDWADRRVNFGGYQYQMFFDSRSPYYTPLPRKPHPAARYPREDCRCPHCASEGLYAQSPTCRFWRATCWQCNGERAYTVFTKPNRGGGHVVDCENCHAEWPLAVEFFRKALHSPAATARELRSTAATHEV